MCRQTVKPVVLSAPAFPVKVTVAYCLGYVLELYVLTAVEVGDSAGYLQYAVICAGREVEPCHCGL